MKLMLIKAKEGDRGVLVRVPDHATLEYVLSNSVLHMGDDAMPGAFTPVDKDGNPISLGHDRLANALRASGFDVIEPQVEVFASYDVKTAGSCGPATLGSTDTRAGIQQVLDVLKKQGGRSTKGIYG